MTPAEVLELLHEDKNLGWRAESVIRWLMDRVLKLEREVKRLKRAESVAGKNGLTNHAASRPLDRPARSNNRRRPVAARKRR